MKKGNLTLAELIGILIGFALLVGVLFPITKLVYALFGSEDSALLQFNDMGLAMQDMGKDGQIFEVKDFVLQLEKENNVVAYPSSKITVSSEVFGDYDINDLSSMDEITYEHFSYFLDRPLQCGNMPCICLFEKEAVKKCFVFNDNVDFFSIPFNKDLISPSIGGERNEKTIFGKDELSYLFFAGEFNYQDMLIHYITTFKVLSFYVEKTDIDGEVNFVVIPLYGGLKKVASDRFELVKKGILSRKKSLINEIGGVSSPVELHELCSLFSHMFPNDNIPLGCKFLDSCSGDSNCFVTDVPCVCKTPMGEDICEEKSYCYKEYGCITEKLNDNADNADCGFSVDWESG